ncbi:gonadotropin-releasing hormone receptor-like [Carcharodon carcharias]|uniref:gonadotropin-releasing hormone receptor-like n=1 Tax=Carcharodon carcharias TaxID=13397 RepID=UPI001B7ED75B|nr:gonadotropin-releasing hormone receptor-like [Carcharodon carcharias]
MDLKLNKKNLQMKMTQVKYIGHIRKALDHKPAYTSSEVWVAIYVSSPKRKEALPDMVIGNETNDTLVRHMESRKNCFLPLNDSLAAPVFNCSLHLPTLTISGVIRVAITFFLLIFSIAGNTIFLVKLSKQHQKKESRLKLLLDNLIVANLLQTLIVMPMDGIWNITVQWYGGEFLCKVLNFLKLFSMYCPAFMLVVISVDRCLAITNPLKSATKCVHTGKCMIATAWFFSMVLALPQLFLFKMIHFSEPLSFSQCATLESFHGQLDQKFYNLFTFGFLFVMPLLIMLICNSRIIIKMTSALHPKDNQMELSRSRNVLPQARMKTIKLTAAFATSFIVCWTPYYFMGIWYWFDPDLHNKLPDPINHFLFLFGLLNPCLDPFIYGYFSL